MWSTLHCGYLIKLGLIMLTTISCLSREGFSPITRLCLAGAGMLLAGPGIGRVAKHRFQPAQSVVELLLAM